MITFRRLKNTITGQIDGKPFNLPRTSESEKDLKAMQDNENITEDELFSYIDSLRQLTIAGSNEFLVFKPATGEYFLHVGDIETSTAIPKNLVKIIEESYDKDIDFTPIVKAWARLLNNPRFNAEMVSWFNNNLNTTYVDEDQKSTLIEDGYSPEAAEVMSTYPDISITNEGLLATYKVAKLVSWEYIMEWDKDSKQYTKIRNPKYKLIPAKLDLTTGSVITPESYEKPKFKEDYLYTPAIHTSGDKFFSGKTLGYVYQVGKLQRLPVKAKRNLDNTFGGGGLYIGGLNYIKGYGGAEEDSRTLTCFVNPSDILSFQDDGLAIRVDALFPNNVWEKEVLLKGKYHSSDYDKVSTLRLKTMIKEAAANNTTVLQQNKEANSNHGSDIDLSDE